jgi:FtsH-binding integral membrane protein
VSQDVQRHLARVYAAVGVNVLAAAAAAAATIALDLTSWNTLFAILTLAAVWPLMSMPPSPARSALWVAFGALEGASLGGFVSQLNALDPSIVPKALVGTAIIFACFSGAAMLCA